MAGDSCRGRERGPRQRRFSFRTHGGLSERQVAVGLQHREVLKILRSAGGPLHVEQPVERADANKGAVEFSFDGIAGELGISVLSVDARNPLHQIQRAELGAEAEFPPSASESGSVGSPGSSSWANSSRPSCRPPSSRTSPARRVRLPASRRWADVDVAGEARACACAGSGPNRTDQAPSSSWREARRQARRLQHLLGRLGVRVSASSLPRDNDASVRPVPPRVPILISGWPRSAGHTRSPRCDDPRSA